MKAILMAAGLGTRISKHINKPKSTLEIEDTSIIRRAVKLLTEKGIEVAIIVGYQKELIYEELKDLPVKFYFNPFYRITNSMGSLWFAKDFINPNEDLILGNADVFWEIEILEKLLEDKREAVMLADSTRVEVGDFFFYVKNERLYDYGKELPVENRNCEYVGLAKIKSSFIPGFMERLDFIMGREDYNKWWESVFYDYLEEYEVNVLDVAGLFWEEVDTFEEYETILEFLRNHKNATR